MAKMNSQPAEPPTAEIPTQGPAGLKQLLAERRPLPQAEVSIGGIRVRLKAVRDAATISMITQQVAELSNNPGAQKAVLGGYYGERALADLYMLFHSIDQEGVPEKDRITLKDLLALGEHHGADLLAAGMVATAMSDPSTFEEFRKHPFGEIILWMEGGGPPSPEPASSGSIAIPESSSDEG